MQLILITIIKWYQSISRALFMRHCRFYPSCSHYAIEAVEKYGPAKGLLKSFLRIIRCSPLSKGGYDPLN